MKQDNKKYMENNISYDLNEHCLISPLDSESPLFEPKIRLGVLASGNGSNFEYIIKSIQNKQLNAEISILIVNNPNCLAIKKAIKYKIPYVIINHRDCNSRKEHDKLVMNKLEELSVSLFNSISRIYLKSSSLNFICLGQSPLIFSIRCGSLPIP